MSRSAYVLLTLLILEVGLSDCVTIQFADPEGAFLLKPYSDATLHSSSLVRPNNANNYSFVVLKDGHVGNKLIVSDSGFTAEENLETLLIRNYSNSASALSLHVLNAKVSKEQPSVRIFVYHRLYSTTTSTSSNSNNNNSNNNNNNNNNNKAFNAKKRKKSSRSLPCVTVYAVYKSRAIFGQCRPQLIDQGVCVVDLVLPLVWWPRQPVDVENPPKRPKTFVKIAFTVGYDDDQQMSCHNEPALMTPKSLETLAGGVEKTLSAVQDVELIGQTKYVSLPFDKILNILVPNKEFHPGNIFTTTIFYRYNPLYTDQPPYLFQIRCHAAQGIRILGTEEIADSGWTAPSEMNYKLSTLTITAFYGGQFNANESWSGEIITLVLQVSPDAKSEIAVSTIDNVTVVQKPTLLSSISYIVDAKFESSSSSDIISDRSSENLTKPLNVQTTFNIEKDAVQALVPVGKFDLVNTGVLTGKQVSVGLKVFSLSHSGVVSDVTMQSTCTAREPSVLKVTPRCTSVYVDGSESRGDMNASIEIDFGNYKGWACYKVWYPEFPVDIWIADPVLHAIKSWRVVDRPLSLWRRKKRQPPDRPKAYSKCRLRYQESIVKVFARFRVDDLATGGRSYLGGRKLQMDVTYLSKSHLKVNDLKVAQLKFVDGVALVQGLYPGRTELQLVSPYSRIPIGAGQVEVTNEQLNIRNLRAQSLAGISLTVLPDAFMPDVYTVFIHRSRIFTKKYQEGRLSVAIEYSNGFSFPLDLVDVADYHLDVAIRDTSLALHGNNQATGLPTFLTVEEIKGNVLYLSLFPSPPCQQNIDGPLISSTVFVEAYFPALSDQRGKSAESPLFPSPVEPQNMVAAKTSVQNVDAVHRARYADPKGQLEHPNPSTVNNANINDKKPSNQLTTALTPAEVAVYIFLALFALIGSIFALHCLASTNRRAKWNYLIPDWLRLNGFRRQPVASARQEFVWVGPEELLHHQHGDSSLSSRCSHRLLQNQQLDCDSQEDDNEIDDDDWRDVEWLPPEMFADRSDDDDEPRLAEAKYSTVAAYNATYPGSVAEQSAVAAKGAATMAAASNRISYLGSEVSIHMCPKPLMEIHSNGGGRRASSWNHRAACGSGGKCTHQNNRERNVGGGRQRHSDRQRRSTAVGNGRRVRITSNPIGDSSSEQNLSSYCAAAASPPPWTAHSAADLHWDSTSLGMNETQLRDYFNSLRESMA